MLALLQTSHDNFAAVILGEKAFGLKHPQALDPGRACRVRLRQAGPIKFLAGLARKYAIYFHFPWSEEDVVTISLPKGYALDNADAPAPIGAGGISRYMVKIQIAKDQTMLIYNRNFFFGERTKYFFRLKVIRRSNNCLTR